MMTTQAILSYHRKAIDILRTRKKALLLKGPSVEHLEKSIEVLDGKDIIYITNNDYTVFNEGFLGTIGRKIDVLFLFCTKAASGFAGEIIKFLKDEETLMLFTTTEALDRIADLLEIHALDINLSKIYLLDNLHYRVCEILNQNYNPGWWGLTNSFGFIISFFHLLEIEKEMFLFGCDGGYTEDSAGYYHPSKALHLPVKSMYHHELLLFNQDWKLIKDQLLHRRQIRDSPPIINVNEIETLEDFNCIPYDSFFHEARGFNEIVKYPPSEKPSAAEQADYLSCITNNIRIHRIHRNLAGLEDRVSPGTGYRKRELISPSIMSKIFRGEVFE